MGLQVELLEKSFAAVAPHGQQLVDTFYQNLFADYPGVKPLFANANMAEQKKKLLGSLKLVVENLRRPEVLQPTLERMGAEHVAYGAEEAHYPAVGATLLKSLRQTTRVLWTNELEQAWADAYQAVSSLMLQGATASV
ncbi:MAG: globin domain-containing protein [Pirellulales bacterium]|nr:globin domain-containing protein [Pirellulales bacterium]